MAEIPDTYAVAAGFLPEPAARAWEKLSDVSGWPGVFPGWIASLEEDDDRFTATGPQSEKFDLYPHHDAEQRTLDVEVVDELGSADTLRLRLLDMPGGTLVIVAHGKLSGTAPASWEAKRNAIAQGVAELASNTGV